MTKVKICGITNYADARAAAEAGARYLGFVIDCPSSPRSVSVADAAEICRKIKIEFPHIRFVAVLEQRDYDELKEIVLTGLFDVAQLADETPEEICATIREYVEVWKSIVVKSAVDVARGELFRNFADKIAYDAGKGSGAMFDHGLLEGAPVDIIAGGIGPDNIQAIIAAIQPETVDVNSKIESEPGKKDFELIKKLFEQIRNF